MLLNELKSPKGSRKRKKIVGRGRGSGLGKTSGRGMNGQKSRCGSGIGLASEGGQMPLIRRLPKVGFRAHNPTIYQVVNLAQIELKFEKGATIDGQSLKAAGLISSLNKPFKILSVGEISKAVNVTIKAISAKAKEKIEAVGGTVVVLESKKIPINRKKDAKK